MAEKWTNTSSPFSRWIKPNPLAALNHFTVPVSFIFLSFFLCDRLPARIERERYSRDGTRTSKYVPTDSTACKGCKSLKRYHVCVMNSTADLLLWGGTLVPRPTPSSASPDLVDCSSSRARAPGAARGSRPTNLRPSLALGRTIENQPKKEGALAAIGQRAYEETTQIEPSDGPFYGLYRFTALEPSPPILSPALASARLTLDCVSRSTTKGKGNYLNPLRIVTAPGHL